MGVFGIKSGRLVGLVALGALLSPLVWIFAPGSSDSAYASHLRGGLVTAEYHPAGSGHTEEVHIVATMLATVASPANFGSVTVYRMVSGTPQAVSGCSGTSPTNTQDAASNPLFSINTSTYTLQGCFSTPGDYIFEATSSARVSGIANPGGYSSGVQFETLLSIDGSSESSAPTYSAGYMYNIAYSPTLDYTTNMNGLGQGNSAVTYELITSTTSGLGGYGAGQIPCSNLNTSTGAFKVNASLCTGTDTIASKFGGNQLYALKVKATDASGQYSTRDVLLQFRTTSNNAPAFSAYSPSPGSLSVTPGTTETITVSATDVDGDVLDFTENLSKAWITESVVTSSGTGASTVYSKTYTLAPPSGTNETVQFEISVYDDDTFSLSTSIQYDIEAGGVLPPGTPGTPTLVAGAAQLTATFAAPSSGGTVASYRLDVTPTAGGSTTQFSCSAPPAACVLSPLSPLVEYSVVVVATNASASASSSGATETTLAAAAGGSGSSGGSNAGQANIPVIEPTPAPARVQPRATESQQRQDPQVQSGPVLRNGFVSSAPKAPTASLGGRSIQLSQSVPNSSQLNVNAGNLSIGVSIQEQQGQIRESADGTTEIEVTKGSSALVSGTGMRPGSTVQVFLPLRGSNAKELTRISVNADGSFDGSAPFATRSNEAPLPIGKNLLQLLSLDENGDQLVVEMTVNIAQGAPAPEQNRIAGVVPTMSPGQSIATSGGEPVPVRITPVSDQKLAVVEGDGWTMAVNVTSDQGGVEPADGGAILRLVRNESALVSGSGFMPGTRADVWLFSDPTLLGTVTIDENGEFTGEVNIDPSMIPVGEHTLQLQGVGQDGFVKAANMGVVVDDPTTASNTTGEQSFTLIWWVLAATVLAALMIWLLVAKRRRTS